MHAGQPSIDLQAQPVISPCARRQTRSILSASFVLSPPPGTESKMNTRGGSSWLSTARELISRLSHDINVGRVAIISFDTPERHPKGCKFCIWFNLLRSSSGRSNQSPSVSNAVSGRSSESSPAIPKKYVRVLCNTSDNSATFHDAPITWSVKICFFTYPTT